MSRRHVDQLRVGYVPLVDCAPLVVANETGVFKKHGLSIRLEREPGWATIRDKIALGRELDAAHSLAGLAFATTLGIGTIRRPCVTGLVINAHGNAITISAKLWKKGVHSAETLKAYMTAHPGERLRFGTVHPFSSHNFLLRAWFKKAGILAGRDIDVVTMPPSMMSRNLDRDNFAGYCVGEPWNSVAIAEGNGVRLAASSELCPMHPEKILLVSEEFAANRNEEHLAMIRALLEACRFCDDPANRGQIAAILSRPEYLNVPKKQIANSLTGTFDCGDGTHASNDQFHLFSGDEVNRPTIAKANWLMSQIRLTDMNHQIKTGKSGVPVGRIFRNDIYEAALTAA